MCKAIGEGIFLNQSGGLKTTIGQDNSVWQHAISRALLYRVNPDFEPSNGYNGIALYADGLLEDGTNGPGIVGFQSFVQRGGSVQNFEMEGVALKERLRRGYVAFYGAFQLPEELKMDYSVA